MGNVLNRDLPFFCNLRSYKIIMKSQIFPSLIHLYVTWVVSGTSGTKRFCCCFTNKPPPPVPSPPTPKKC